MHLRSNMVLITGLLLVLILLGPMFASADSQIKGRPTRPKEFDSADELKEYLDLVKDYYFSNGKARYGKRAGPLRSVIDTPDYSRELLRLKLNSLEQVFQTLQSNIAENKNSNEHAQQERYPEDYNNLRMPYQLSSLKISRNSNILGKSYDSQK